MGGLPRADIDFASPVPGHLNGDVGRPAEAIQAETLAGPDAAELERPVADDAGTEQRGRFLISKDLRDAIGERFGDHRILRIPAVHVEPRELRRLAQVFASAPAEPTLPAHPSEPCHADPIPLGDQRHSGADRIHSAHHLMSRHDRKPHGLQFALHDMQISPADAAGLHPYPHFPGAGLRHRPLLQGQRSLLHRPAPRQDHGSHITLRLSALRRAGRSCPLRRPHPGRDHRGFRIGLRDSPS